ncbi:uncharacterized protein LOC124453658 [Xenia sp. Carnegie-2017]|uniref:uncharacterized protein LOC124453658 n=1 Tax=Xenia sp. Carnegie-2017 TaxID=2897299 RepID=UPI001F04DCDF|nr:uncharacterized protein LOC124453658 [Xenia sp. Carnegie-2017]
MNELEKSCEANEVFLGQGDGLMRVENLTKCKNAVCMIHCETRCLQTGKKILRKGSGFYVKAKIFNTAYKCVITNHHVVSCEKDAKSSIAIFHYERENKGCPVQLRPDKIFRTNQYLDYSVIGIDENELAALSSSIAPIEYVEQLPANIDDQVFIFQHPRGMPKQFSHEKIIRIDPPFVYYVADTNCGSSGSPVLWKLQLLAIHLLGNQQHGYNKGTLFDAIINDLCNGWNYDNHPKRSRSPCEIDENSVKKKCVNGFDDANKHLPVLDDIFLDKLSKKCQSFYKHLGRRLKVDSDEIEEISSDHVNYRTSSEKCFQIFKRWQDSESSEFNCEVLENALRSLDKNAVANMFFGKK